MSTQVSTGSKLKFFLVIGVILVALGYYTGVFEIDSGSHSGNGGSNRQEVTLIANWSPHDSGVSLKYWLNGVVVPLPRQYTPVWKHTIFVQRGAKIQLDASPLNRDTIQLLECEIQIDGIWVAGDSLSRERLLRGETCNI